MKVKIKIERKAFVRLIMWLNNKDHTAFPEITSIDRLNMRDMYLWCFNKHEQWRNDKNYHAGNKKHTIALDVNHFGTLKKFFGEKWSTPTSAVYEWIILSDIVGQCDKQIEHQIFLNQNLIIF